MAWLLLVNTEELQQSALRAQGGVAAGERQCIQGGCCSHRREVEKAVIELQHLVPPPSHTWFNWFD